MTKNNVAYIKKVMNNLRNEYGYNSEELLADFNELINENEKEWEKAEILRNYVELTK